MQLLATILFALLLSPSLAEAATAIEDEYVRLHMKEDWNHSVHSLNGKSQYTLKSEAKGIEVNFAIDATPRVRADNLKLAATRLHDIGQKNWPATFAREGRTLKSFSSSLEGDDNGWTSTHFGLDSTGENFRAIAHVRVGKVLNVFANSRKQGQSELQAITKQIVAGVRE